MTHPYGRNSQNNAQLDSTGNFEIIETHNQMIERDANEISICWKMLPMLLYLICAICGYGTSILFYIFWNEIFRGNCPIWAHLKPQSPHRKLRDMDELIEEEIPGVVYDDWRKNMILTFKHQDHCPFYHFISLCSCLFGIIWLMLFSMCGKGGYDTRIFTAPWRIVPPAIVFHIIFVPIIIAAVHNFEYGYSSFTENLEKVASLHMNKTQMEKYPKQCDIVQYYLEVYEDTNYGICYVYTVTQVLSWMMALSWLISLGILVFRIMIVNDFRLLKTTVYKQVVKKIERPERKPSVEDTESEDAWPPEPQKRKKIFFFIPE